jgi:hypothetical protein
MDHDSKHSDSDDSDEALNAPISLASRGGDTPAYNLITCIEVRHSVVCVYTVLGVLFWAIPNVYGFSARDLERMAGCLCVPVGWLADELLSVGGTAMGVAVFAASSLPLNDE